MTDLKEICTLIGCSMMDQNCPGNPDCEIIRKIVQVTKEKNNVDH